MEKKIRTYLVAPVLVLYFLLAGTGWNLTRFCCVACERAGIEQVAYRSCKAIHGQVSFPGNKQVPVEDVVCSDMAHHAGGCCQLLRLVLDNAIVKYEQHIPPAVEFSVFDLPTFDSFRSLSDADFAAAAPVVTLVPESLRISGKILLPHICIWLI